MQTRCPPKMRRKRETGHNEVLALVVLSSHEGKWLGAVEVAEQLGRAWRPLAFALRRLVERGIADEMVVQVPGTARSKEDRRVYRVRGHAGHPLFPTAYRPPPGVGRLVIGRFSLRRRDADEDDLTAGAVRVLLKPVGWTAAQPQNLPVTN